MEPCAWQGSYLDSLQCGAGEGLVWGTGRAPWEAGTGFAAPRQKAATETPKQLCSEVVGRNNTPGGDGMGPQSSHSLQLASPSCVIRAVVTGRGHCSGGLTVVWGSSAFRLLTLVHPCCAKLSSAPSAEGGAGPCVLGVRRPPEQELGPGEKSITQQLEEGLQV